MKPEGELKRIPFIKCAAGHLIFKSQDRYPFWLEKVGESFHGECNQCDGMQMLKVCVKTRKLMARERR